MTDNTPTTKQEEGGLVTVPRVPTDDMIEAGAMCDAAFGKDSEGVYYKPEFTWSAMIAAAPATPPHNEDGLRKALGNWRNSLAESEHDDLRGPFYGEHNVAVISKIDALLARLEDWRCVGLALAIAAGAVADMIRAENRLPPFQAPK